MNTFAVIMAGGSGTRFWPRSRKTRPKQLLNIIGKNTMIQQTVDRLSGIVASEKIIIITNQLQEQLLREQLSVIPSQNIIAEPVARNTAACVGLSALLVAEVDPEAVIITLPADHLIGDQNAFMRIISLGIEVASSQNAIVTLGIKPSRAETGYGYIKAKEQGDIVPVEQFVEKPDLATAQQYLDSGQYLWNSGMFIWQAKTILNEMKEYLPELLEPLSQLKGHFSDHNFTSRLAHVYKSAVSISIDRGVIEKSRQVMVIASEFGWSDVGSWQTVYELGQKDEAANVLEGNVYGHDISGCYIYSPDRFTAAIGLKDVVAVNLDDSLLLCSRDRVQDVKKIVDFLQGNNMSDLI